MFESVKKLLNGYGRAIFFKSKILKNNEIDMNDRIILSQIEGRFMNGSIDGFARKFDSDGSCKVGYWKPVGIPKMKKGEKAPNYLQVQGPYGKWAYY